MKYLYSIFLLFPTFVFSQIVNEVVQIDTTFETLKVIYQPEKASTYYYKKIAVFADNPSQIAIEKSYTNYGQNGLYKVYYPNGKLKIQTVFANNKIYGEWTYYNPEGIIITKGKYREGIKHGYWAYKSLRIYGRYKKGYKHKRWKRVDESENKHISHYRMGKLKAGEGFGDEIPFYLNSNKEKIKKTEVKDTNAVVVEVKDTTSIIKEYEQTISFLASNVLLRKAIKKHFGTSMKKSLAIKKLYDNKDRFLFALSPEIKALELTYFFKERESGKIVVAKIDEVLKEKPEELKAVFTGEKIKEEPNLYENSTLKESPITIVFSEVKSNLLRLDVNWTFKEEQNKFKILLYFDDLGVLKGAEYQKP